MNDAELVLKHIELQDLSKAKEIFNKVKKSGSPEEKFFLAEQLSQYGFLEEAKELYERLLEVFPEESELKIMLAELLIDLGKDEEAYPYLETVEPTDPNYAAALLLEADLYQMQGLYEVSEQKLLKAKEMYSQEPVIDFALAELYMSLGRFLEAVTSYQRLLKAEEETVGGNDIYARLAEALSAGGAFEESIPYYEKSLENSKDLNVLFGYGLTSFQAGLYKKAKNAFEELKTLDHEYHALYLYLAKSYDQLGDLDKAIETAEQGLAADEYNADLYIYIAGLLMKAGREEEAEDALHQALALDPESTEAASLLNKLLLHQERYEDVLEVLSNIKNADDSQLHWDAAYSYQQIENYSEALNEYKLAYNELKNNLDFLKDYGFFLMEEGMRSEGAAVFRRLSSLDPSNEEWHEIIDRLEE
ncbi:tetratricopeptide repeat protein [Siminovitchia terrae]|uniref:Tetratricopeptide repeat protein n=1 Tax=Siminovitchia terrae TaxID=1914933 RepID=A0A429X4F3_SIMTE|nr:tetratricopeptide repeat protein [Siminovitchia terrae]RST58231.1 tetratricopeptide repeat protein [Siminovitchia terrae]